MIRFWEFIARSAPAAAEVQRLAALLAYGDPYAGGNEGENRGKPGASRSIHSATSRFGIHEIHPSIA